MSSDRRPSSDGVVPESWLEHRNPQYEQPLVSSWPVTSNVRLPICVGICAVMLLFESVSWVALVTRPSSVGTEPVSSFE